MEPEQVTTDEKPSLRDTIIAAVEQAEAPPETQTPDRGRDDSGKFVKGEKKDAAAKAKEPKEPGNGSLTPTPSAAAPIKRPSSWKKDYWEKYDALDEELRNYILQREDEAARGISNYKTEADKAKTLWEAIAPFQSDLEKNGIDPAKHIADLFGAHRTLALASPFERQQMFMRLAQDYQVPLQNLVQGTQGQQPNSYLVDLTNRLSNIERGFTEAQQREQASQEASVRKEVEDFAGQSEQFPHFEQVRLKMAALLQAGEADDLKSAYEKAVRLDDTLYEQMIEARHAEKLQKDRETKDAAAKAARERAVQVRGSSPTPRAPANTKGLRNQLEAAFDSVTGTERV